MTDSSVHDLELTTLAGEPEPLGTHRGRLLLAVNVASRCGLTPPPEGIVLRRFRPRTAPDAPELVGAIEEHLPGAG